MEIVFVVVHPRVEVLKGSIVSVDHLGPCEHGQTPGNCELQISFPGHPSWHNDIEEKKGEKEEKSLFPGGQIQLFFFNEIFCTRFLENAVEVCFSNGPVDHRKF